METIHQIVKRGDVGALRRSIGSTQSLKVLVNEVDENGFSPLYYAVSASEANPEIVALLLESGGDPGFVKVKSFPGLSSDWLEELGEDLPELAEDISPQSFDSGPTEHREPLLRAALKNGNLEILRLLQRHGADYDYHDEHNYTAILDAVYGVEERLPVIQYLIGLGLDVRAATSYGESAVGVAYHFGQFQVIAELLGAGADEAALQWTPLHRSVAIGTLEDVEEQLERGGDLASFDRWGRRPIHIALLKGSWEVVELLRRKGADLAQSSKEGLSSLYFAAQGKHLELVNRILELGSAPEDKDDALIVAVERGDHDIAKALLEAGANPSPKKDFGTLLEEAPDRGTILLLYEYGADLSDLDSAGRRRLLGLPDDTEHALDAVSREEYLIHRYADEARANPQNIGDPFRLAMIRSGWNAYWAREHFDDPATFVCGPRGSRPPAVWCFDRFGQSTTILPGGRTILIAGEHEDSYDPDFCIYNDVAVFDPDGTITLYGYPFSAFPPTDFHSATLVGSWIYVVGSLGYAGTREGQIPVYRLSLENFRIEPVETVGKAPGRIYKHRARLTDDGNIRIEGGNRISFQGVEENHDPNANAYVLDLRTLAWSQL